MPQSFDEPPFVRAPFRLGRSKRLGEPACPALVKGVGEWPGLEHPAKAQDGVDRAFEFDVMAVLTALEYTREIQWRSPYRVVERIPSFR